MRNGAALAEGGLPAGARVEPDVHRVLTLAIPVEDEGKEEQETDPKQEDKTINVAMLNGSLLVSVSAIGGRQEVRQRQLPPGVRAVRAE